MDDAERSGTTPGSLLEHGRELCAASLDYLRARLELAGIEGKEALIHVAILAGLLAGAIAVLIFGWLFFCAALVALIAHFLHIPIGWILLAGAVLHLLVAVGCLIGVKLRLGVPIFHGTLEELRKDRQWLSARK